MKRFMLICCAVSFVAVLTSATLAQQSAPGNQEARPGPGYGMGPGMMGPGYGPGYGWGQGMMGPGYGFGPGYAWGPGMMGPGYGYGPGEAPTITPEEREARAKAFVEEYLRRNLPGYNSLEKKPPAKKK